MNPERSRPGGDSFRPGRGGTRTGNRIALVVVLALVAIAVVVFLVAVRGQ
jgi:hypothetical protein